MILAKASSSGSRALRRAWLRHLAMALAVVAFASGTASAQYTTIDYLTEKNDFNPTPIGGPYASVKGGATYDSGEDTTTINFLVEATDTNNSIVSFAFNTDVLFDEDDYDEVFTVYAGATSGFPELSVTVQENFNVTGPAGKYTYNLNFSSNTTSAVLVEILAAGEFTVDDFRQTNDKGFMFAAHLKSPAGSENTGFVYGPGVVPEPASVIMLGMSSVVGLGYAWRKRKTAVA
jgi:hypothetical protein